MRTMTGKAKQT